MRGALVGLIVVVAWPAAAQLPYQDPGPFAVGVTVVDLVKPSVTTGEPRALATQVWYPATPGTGTPEGAFLRGAAVAKGRFPLVVFSHGSCGIPNQSVFLMEALASRGFIVAAPPHPGNTFSPTCSDPASLADAYRNRPADVTFVADGFIGLGRDRTSRFFRHVNGKRLGVSGHSFGGQTTLRVAASDRRFRAALALAPGLVPEDGLVIRAPLMVMTGEVDSLTPFQTEAVPSYDLGIGPRFLVEILNAGHCAFIPLCAEQFCGAGCAPANLEPAAANAFVRRYAVPFMLRYLKGDRAAGKTLRRAAAPDGIVLESAGRRHRRR